MTDQNRAYLELHIATFIYGFAAIFGALISLPTVPLVWWRLLLSVALLGLYLPFYRELRQLNKSQILIFLGIGGIIAIHWLCFYGSIKLANASVALITFSATPFFTSIIEPLVTKTEWKKVDIFFGLLIIPAMSLILVSIDLSMFWGAVVGIMSGLLAAVFSAFNKKYIDVISPISFFTIEIIGAFIVVSLVLPFVQDIRMDNFFPSGMDWWYFLGLVIFVTILGFLLNLRALKHVSAFTSNFIISLEPVYGIALAIFILKEHRELTSQFYIGVLIMLALVFIYPLVKRRV